MPKQATGKLPPSKKAKGLPPSKKKAAPKVNIKPVTEPDEPIKHEKQHEIEKDRPEPALTKAVVGVMRKHPAKAASEPVKEPPWNAALKEEAKKAVSSATDAGNRTEEKASVPSFAVKEVKPTKASGELSYDELMRSVKKDAPKPALGFDITSLLVK